MEDQKMFNFAKLYEYETLWEKGMFVSSETPGDPLYIEINKEKIPYGFIRMIWLNFYDLLMNSNPSSLDIIYTDEFSVGQAYYHKANSNNVIIEEKIVENLDSNILKELTTNPKTCFEDIRVWIQKNLEVEIGNIRLIPVSLYEHLQKIILRGRKDQNISVIELFCHLLDSILLELRKNKLYIYPFPPLFQFLLGISQYFTSFSCILFQKMINSHFPSILQSCSFVNEDSFCSFLISKADSSDVFRFQQPFYHQGSEIKREDLEYLPNYKSKLQVLKKKYKSSPNFLISLPKFKELLKMIMNFQFPLSDPKDFQLILSKLLLFIKNYEISYWAYPKPLKYNDRLRFWYFLLGFRVNYKKLSYWAFPTIFHDIISFSEGISGSYLFFIGKNERDLTSTIQDCQGQAFLLQYENNLIKKVSQIKETVINELLQNVQKKVLPEVNKFHKDDRNLKILSAVREEYSHLFKQNISVGWISTKLIDSLILSVVSFYKPLQFPLGKMRKILKLCKSPNHLLCFPQSLILQNIRSKSTLNLLKDMSLLISDHEEF